VKIERTDEFSVSISLNHPLKDANRVKTHSRDVVVKITTSGETVGWGAGSPRTFYTREIQNSAFKVSKKDLLSPLEGDSPFDIEANHIKMEAAIPFHCPPKSAIDCALYDLQGQALDQLVYNHLGGGENQDEMPSFDGGL
jgi:L-alanine-DL-glutamate epimerase-like enolase superfamily enzyme